MAGDGGFLDILSGVGGLLNLGSDIWSDITNQQSLDWEKQAQQITWAREDDAVQRRAADMAKAGINPLLAAGSPAAAGGPVSLPHQSFGAGDLGGVASQIMGLMTARKQIAQTEAETARISTQEHQVDLANQMQQAQAMDALRRYGPGETGNSKLDLMLGFESLAKITNDQLSAQKSKAIFDAVAANNNSNYTKTVADSAARDLAIAVDRNLPSGASPAVTSLIDWQDYAAKHGVGPILYGNLLKNLGGQGLEMLQNAAASGAKAIK